MLGARRRDSFGIQLASPAPESPDWETPPGRRTHRVKEQLSEMVGREAKGRVLLVAYFFGDAGTGAFRWNEMTRQLAASGWGFDVIMRGGGAAAAHGETTGAPGVRVFPVAEPRWPSRLVGAPLEWARAARHRLRRAGGAARAAAPQRARAEPVVARWPRVRVRLGQRVLRALQSAGRLGGELIWTWRAARLGARLLRAGPYRAVIVSTPPHAAQLAGARLARRFGVPFVADYRDPWYFGLPRSDYASHPTQILLGRMYEGAVMRRARLVLCCAEGARQAAERLYDLNGRTVTLPNGYDAEPPVPRPDRDVFRVVYAGALYPYHEVRALLGACERFRARVGPGETRFRLEFMGAGHAFRGIPIAQLAAGYELADCFVDHGPGERAEALRLQQSAAVLVMFDHFHGLSVPTKFYDYAQLYGAPLAIGSPEGNLAGMAARVHVRVYEPTDAAGLDAAMDAAYERWSTYAYETPTDAAGIFDRRHQSARLGELLARLAAPQAAS